MRKAGLLASAFFLMILTGCSMAEIQGAYEEKAGDFLLRYSGVKDGDSYRQYEELKDKGALSEEGYYNELGEYEEEYAADIAEYGSIENIESEKKQVHVTFAQNSFLKINYFYDESLTEPIETDNCYLNLGESIYASQPECDNPYTDSYVFSEYRIYEYDSDGNRDKDVRMFSRESRVLTIPEDFTGTELSVEPVGEYQRQAFFFDAYMINNAGDHIEVGGVWKVNGEAYTEDTIELNPSDTYKVEYFYDKETYYVAASNPSYYSDHDGKVEFPITVLPEDSYSVQLHSYIKLSLDGDADKIASASVSGKEISFDVKKEKAITGLKAGDEVCIKTTEGYRLYCGQFPLEQPETLENDECRYTFEVPESNEEIRLLVSKTTLTVSVDESVGSDIAFNIETSSFLKSYCAYSKEKAKGLHRDCTIAEDAIGAEESMQITALKGMLSSGYALRFDITKTDRNDKKTKEVNYLTEVPGTQTIEVYENGTPDNDGKVYTSIDIKISCVKVKTYTQEKIANGVIELNFTDVDINTELHDGDAVEDSREIEVVMKPDKGYYISGKKVSDDNCYRDNMKYEKYCADLAEILKDHQSKKFIQVTLDAADDYGKCLFKLDGQQKSGKVDLKVGQELKLTYTLTDNKYEIIRESKGIWGWLTDRFSSNNNEESVSIEITDELDGKTITRDQYITIKKK